MLDRKSHWENIYSNKSPQQVSWHQVRPDVSLKVINNSMLPDDSPIIDIGGGASTLVDCLIGGGYKNISVLDISKNALEHAKIRLADKANLIEWHEEDVTRFVSKYKYSIWHDRAVFHFLINKADREKYLNVLKESLAQDGHVIIAAFALDGPNKCSGLDVVNYDEGKICNELGDDFELLDIKKEIHLTPDSNEQKFVYFHFKKIK